MALGVVAAFQVRVTTPLLFVNFKLLGSLRVSNLLDTVVGTVPF